MKNNAAVAEAVQERARVDDTVVEPEVSALRIAEETLAAAKFKKLAQRIALDAAADDLATGVGAGESTTRVRAPFGEPNANPDAALVPRQLSVLEQVSEVRRGDKDDKDDKDDNADGTASRDTDADAISVQTKQKKPAVPDETPGERLKRLFREKRERGLARVRDKFENQQMFDELAGSSIGDIDSEKDRETLASRLEKGEELFGAAAEANRENKAIDAGGVF